MPIVLRHQAAGIAPDQENPRTKYGMAMVLQQQRADQQMRQRTQDQQYDMQRMGAMGAMREMREPSIGEDDAMLEQEIRSGLYDPDTVRALRQDQRAMRQIMRDTNIDGTQRAQALGNLQSRMRMSRSTGKVQPMMQQMGPAALQTKPPMTEAEYFSDEKNYANAYAAAQARLEAAGPDTPVTPENIQAQMHNDYLAKQKFLQGLSQPQPNAPAAAPAGQPQASYTGGQPTFGGSPVMAQGGFSQNGGQQYDPSMVQPIVDAMRTPAATSPAANRNGSSPYFGIALAPGHPDYKAPPTPTNRIDERGYVIMSDGSKVDPRDDFAMSTGGRGEQAVERLTHPDGSQIERRPDYMMPENYLASNAQGGIQQNSMRLVGEPGIPNLIAGLGGPSDYRPQFNAQGGMGASVGPGAYQPGGYTSPEVFGAANVLANPAKQQYAEVSGGNRDTQYSLQNPQMSAGQAYFDRNNPVRQEMSAADQSIVNPQKETLGKPGGRYGLGMIDYGINPATGNRVTASIRPGGTMPEYDEPVGPPGTAMGGGRGGLTIMRGRKKPAPAATAETAEVSPGGTPVKDEPKTKQALAIPPTPNAASYQYQSPLAQAASVAMSAPQPSASAVPASKYGRSASTSALGREVEAAMQAGDELAAKEQQQAVEIATSLSPEPMTDAERKNLGLPTLKEMEEMRKNLDRNKTMGGIGLGGTGRAAGSYEPIKADKLPKDKGASATAQQKKASPQQTGMSQSLTDFASKQRPDVQNAIKEAYNPKLSERARENAIRFLLTQGIDLSEIL